MRIFLIMFMVLSLLTLQALQTTFAQNADQRMFQTAKIEKILSIERLAELSEVTQGNNSVIFTEVNWNSDGKSIIFESMGMGIDNVLWMVSLEGKDIQKISFPFDQFSDVFGYKISPDDEILFAAITRGESGQGQGPTNLYTFNTSSKKLAEITNYTGNTFVGSYDWMPQGNIVYETRESIYQNPDDPNEMPNTELTLWLAKADGQDAEILLNETDAGFAFHDASPDGKLVGLHQNHLARFDADERKVSDINFGVSRTDSEIIDNYPKWSSNSEYIAYWGIELPDGSSGSRPMGNLTLRIASSDGSLDEAIFKKPGFPVGGQTSPVGISPDGRFIAFEISYDPESSYNNRIDMAGIYLVDLGTVRIPEFPGIFSMVGSAAFQVALVAGVVFTIMLAMTRNRTAF